MSRPLALHPDRLFPADPATRAIARDLYEPIRGLPILSPHGHTDPAWFATDAPFDSEQGRGLIANAIAAVNALEIPAAEKDAIFAGNARKLLRL